MLKLATILLIVFLSGCVTAPARSPAEQRAYDIKKHCKDVAYLARTQVARQQSKGGGFWGGVAQGREQNTAGKVAYRECMLRFR